MNVLMTSNIPNPIITPEEVRAMVYALAEANPSLPDYVTKVIVQDDDNGDVAFKIYARHFRIPVVSLDQANPDAVIEIGILDPEKENSPVEVAAKIKATPYLFMQIPELPVTGVRGFDNSGEATVIKAEDFKHQEVIKDL
jgi:hypothetical protein